jgi:Fur family ferric uptake transcriptional regulator
VGLATIYRQLEKLEEAGRIHRVPTEEGALYQYCPHPADGGCFLLRCEDCGRIVHLDCSHLEELYRHLESEHHFRIDPRRTVLTGLCQTCAQKETFCGI